MQWMGNGGSIFSAIWGMRERLCGVPPETLGRSCSCRSLSVPVQSTRVVARLNVKAVSSCVSCRMPGTSMRLTPPGGLKGFVTRSMSKPLTQPEAPDLLTRSSSSCTLQALTGSLGPCCIVSCRPCEMKQHIVVPLRGAVYMKSVPVPLEVK